MNRATAERASRICQLAQIIQDTEGVDANRAYDEAEQLIDAPPTQTWLAHQPDAPGTLTLATVRGLVVLRRGGVFFTLRPDELATVEAFLAARLLERAA